MLELSEGRKLAKMLLIRTTANILTFLIIKPENNIIKKEIHGQSMLLNSKDKGLSQELLVYGIHEPFLTTLISNKIENGAIVVELGANIGYYTLKECLLVKPYGKVIAIEPDPRSRFLLEQNIAINGHSNNVIVIPVAIASHRNKGKLMLRSAYNITSIKSNVLANNLSKADEIEIELVPLDEIILHEKRIDMIRMDIEGYEYEVIKGMMKSLIKFKPLLIFELHPITDKTLMLSFFQELSAIGYEIEWAIPRHLVDGVLSVPTALLKQTLTLVVTNNVSPSRISGDAINMNEFARHFISEGSVYHVIFESKLPKVC
jgi:FkbM family methyltransferase